MEKISFFDFKRDESVIAPVIYGSSPHRTTNKGLIIGKEVALELKRFFNGYNKAVNPMSTPYYRIDAYFNDKSLTILEVNAAFVDGWGTALNLGRASGICVPVEKLVFPKRFGYYDPLYLPELELFLEELELSKVIEKGIILHSGYNGVKFDEQESIYVYGRNGKQNQSNLIPCDGIRIDNKMNLGLFSKEWFGDCVQVPRHYLARFNSWEEIPKEVVLKFCDKGSEECRRARQSVLFNKPEGKAKFLRECYRNETLLAQDFIEASKQDGNSCQLIIFVIGDEPITGYVQYSRASIINDNSIHGPLWIKN